MNREPTTLTREALYELVWSEPVSRLAARYGLSDVGFAKICRDMRIPLPGRGYWQQRSAGKNVHRPRLMALPNGSPPSLQQVTFSSPDAQGRIVFESELVLEQRRYESMPDHRIVVAEQLSDPHPLVTQTGHALRRIKPDASGVIPIWGKPILDVRVTPQLMDRALRVMDALVKALEQRGISVHVSKDGEVRTFVRILEQEVSLLLDEPLRQIRTDPRARDPLASRHAYVPSGELRIRARIEYFGHRHQKDWRDGKARRVEDCLNKVVIGIVAAAERRGEAVKRFEAAQEGMRRAHASYLQRLRTEQEEQARIAELEKATAAWVKSQQIREFVAAIRARLSRDVDSPAARDGAEELLDWALQHADELDPLSKDDWIQKIQGVRRF